MFSQLFGKYLVEKEIIKDADYITAIEKQLSIRVKLGTIAIAEGLLTEDEVETINKLQMQFDKRFGDIAIEKGLLSESEISGLLEKQGNPYMQFIQALTETTGLSPAVLDKTLVSFQKEKGFSDEEMVALKSDNIDALIPIFAASAKPHVTELAGLFLRNINRFVSRDFYADRIKHIKSLPYKNLAGQRIVGNATISLALLETDENGAFATVASGFFDDSYNGTENDAFDAVCEFINVNSGLFASELSKDEVDFDMEPTFAYKDQSVEGDFYVLPIYIENRAISLVIAVNSPVEMGKIPYVYSSNEDIVYTARTGSKGSVLIVDDSRMSRNMLSAILEDEGYSIIAEASDGVQAVAAYKQHKPDLVTLDITMPNMDGIEALKEILKEDASAKAIMITAAGQQSKLIEALKLGAKKFITKPYEKDEVINNINEVMK